MLCSNYRFSQDQLVLYPRKKLHLIIWILLFAFLSSCSTTPVAPVANRSKTQAITPSISAKNTASNTQKIATEHIVIPGDTLYFIAWTYGLDYKNIARWNNIQAPYLIYPKQKIRLIAAKNKPTITVKKTVKKNLAPPIHADQIDWQWPTQGKLTQLDSLVSKKGLNILGKNGQIIRTAAPGQVVYSGSGLQAYSKLVIIKHNATYLSAYAHNSEVMVREGEHVVGGQQIARMGKNKAGKTLLHFEIRKDGEPTDPINYLPKNK